MEADKHKVRGITQWNAMDNAHPESFIRKLMRKGEALGLVCSRESVEKPLRKQTQSCFSSLDQSANLYFRYMGKANTEHNFLYLYVLIHSY